MSERDYDQRCANCRHNIWQNEAVGDCRVFHKDVLHHSVHACSEFNERPPDQVTVWLRAEDVEGV